MKYFLNISGIFDADWDFPYKIISSQPAKPVSQPIELAYAQTQWLARTHYILCSAYLRALGRGR